MGEKGLGVRVGETLEVRAATFGVDILAADEAHAVQAVDLLADLAGVQVRARHPGGLGEVMVQVAAEVDILLGGETDHLARLGDVVGNRLLDQHILAGGEGLHGRLEMPAAVLVSARADVDDVEVPMGLEHVLETGVCLHLVLGGGLVGAGLDDVTDGDQFGEGIGGVGGGMHLADAAQADDSDFKWLHGGWGWVGRG